jgi:nucleotide-binding universal stress UspA family protein
MISKILVAYDGSEPSNRAFDFAIDLTGKYNAEVVVLSVARPPEPPVDVEIEAVLESATEYYEERFKELKERASALGVTPRFEVRAGHPAEQIIHMANEESTDMIVMGYKGESFMERWLLGSVSKRVLSYAHCTVTIVR